MEINDVRAFHACRPGKKFWTLVKCTWCMEDGCANTKLFADTPKFLTTIASRWKPRRHYLLSSIMRKRHYNDYATAEQETCNYPLNSGLTMLLIWHPQVPRSNGFSKGCHCFSGGSSFAPHLIQLGLFLLYISLTLHVWPWERLGSFYTHCLIFKVARRADWPQQRIWNHGKSRAWDLVSHSAIIQEREIGIYVQTNWSCPVRVYDQPRANRASFLVHRLGLFFSRLWFNNQANLQSAQVVKEWYYWTYPLPSSLETRFGHLAGRLGIETLDAGR